MHDDGSHRRALHQKFETASNEGRDALADVIASDAEELTEMLVEDRASLARVLAAASARVLAGRRVDEREVRTLARALVDHPMLLSTIMIESA